MRRLLKIVLVGGIAVGAVVLLRRLLLAKGEAESAGADSWPATPPDAGAPDPPPTKVSPAAPDAEKRPQTQASPAAPVAEMPDVGAPSSSAWQPAAPSSGGGPANSSPSRDELYKEAARLGVKGRSKMNKRQLQEAVEAARTGGSN